MSMRRYSAFVALASALTFTLSSATVSTSAAAPRPMTPLQVAKVALLCASRNQGLKITTYFNILCAANHSTNISVSAGVVGGPSEYPAYSSIGFLFDKTTGAYTCYAYPDVVGAMPVNVTNNCPLWIMPTEYAKTNYPSAYAISTAFSDEVDSQPPDLAQLQGVATQAAGHPTVTAGSGTIFGETSAPELTVRVTYSSGIDRQWCLWFYQQTDAAGQSETTSLISPPGMYGTC